MKAPDKPANEAERVAWLYRLDLLDRSASEGLEALTRCAREALHAPIALISLIDHERQWFMCKLGVDADETPRELSFCAHAIHTPEPFVVNDALLDERFADHPLVIGPPHVRSYLGMPLVSGDGSLALGSLCVVDSAPRAWSAGDIAFIRDLGKVAMTLIEAQEAHQQIAAQH